MDIRPIQTDDDLTEALKEIDLLWDAEEGSEDFAKLKVLATLVEAYEASRWPAERNDPVETIVAHMAWTDRTQSDLAELLGSRSRASEILGRKRALTLEMIQKLNREWKIPAELLVQPYALTAA